MKKNISSALMAMGCLIFMGASVVYAKGSSDLITKYPEFQLGVTGIYAEIADGKVIVTKTVADTPANNKFKAGDVLATVNGASLKADDPRKVLGAAINSSEGADGKMTFGLQRGGKTEDVVIQLKPIGSYSKTWPLNCKKSATIIEQTAEFLLKVGPTNGGLTTYLDGLFLLSTGNPKYIEASRRWADKFSPGTCGSQTWNNGYHGLFLGEYYLATGDKKVLPTLKALCDDATARQYFGGWNHWGGAGPGYVQGGLMNPAGVQVLTSLILARECGVKFDESTYDKALAYFYRFAGHGGVAYGNHPPEGMGSNGKNGMLACALTLLPEAKFQGAAQMMALAEADTYNGSEGGHASNFGNVMWRGIASVLVPYNKAENYRRHMDNLAWYYDLARMPEGGFWKLPQPGGSRNGGGGAPNYSSGMIGLTYTAPLKTLRITGKPRTKYSLPHMPTKVEGNLEYTDFRKTDNVAGGDDGGLTPPEIMAKFRGKSGETAEKMPVEWYFKMMHHYQSDIRLKAAVALGDFGDPAKPYILSALKSPDARLRTAGLNAIHGVSMWWFYRKSTANAVTPNDVANIYLPYILKPLKDPGAAMWEKVNALWALGKADAGVVNANLPLIRGYLKHDDWWVRIGAWEALSPLTQDPKLLKPVLPDLLECYNRERIVHPNRTMMSRLQTIRKEQESLSNDIIAGMAKGANEVNIVPGYEQPVHINKIYEQFRYMDMKKHPENAVLMVDSARRIMKVMQGQQVPWLFTGDKWGNMGLVNAANKLGKDAKPIIAGLKAMMPDIQRAEAGKSKGKSKGKSEELSETTLAVVQKCIQDYESKYGKVEAAGPR